MATSRGISAPLFVKPILQPAGFPGRVWAFFASRWAVTKRGGERLLVLEDRLAIGPKKSLALVQCAGRRYLVAVSGDAIAALQEVPSRESRPRVRKGGGR
jgi:hypothetical protein